MPTPDPAKAEVHEESKPSLQQEWTTELFTAPIHTLHVLTSELLILLQTPLESLRSALL
jgi:hypothetical protein